MGFENDTYIGTLKICANIRIKKMLESTHHFV